MRCVRSLIALSLVFALLAGCAVSMAMGESWSHTPAMAPAHSRVNTLKSSKEYSVVCDQSSVWLLLPFNRTLVSSCLQSAPTGVTYGTHPFALPDDQWPIFMEFNNPTGCYETVLPWVKTEFHEYKLQIPYLRMAGVSVPVMFKPLIVVDNKINEYSSKLVYGLNVDTRSPMTYDVGAGSYTAAGTKLTLSFKPQPTTWLGGSSGSTSNSDLWTPFAEMANFTQWLGHDVFGRTRCAQNFYNSPSSVRAVTGVLHIDAGFLSADQPAIDYVIDNNAGAGSNAAQSCIQLVTREFITGLHNCPSE